MRRRTCWIPAAAFVAVVACGLATRTQVRATRAASPGLILFASDRDKADPGEIYSLAPGSAPRDVSRSLAADYGLAVAPVGDRIAFWSDRSGTPRVYLARSDGSRLRRVQGMGTPWSADLGSPPAFSADGSKLFVSSTVVSGPAGSPASTGHAYVVDTRMATARALRRCPGVWQAAPDARAVACSFRGTVTVSGLDGRVRFHVPGWALSWSRRGLLALTETDAATPPDRATGLIVDEAGRRVTRIPGLPLNWTPDGRMIALQRGTQDWVMDARGTGIPVILPSPADGSGVSFTPDSRYAATTDDGKPVLVPLNGGPEIQGGPGGGAGAWSPQGRLVYTAFPRQYPLPAGYRAPVYVTDAHGLHPRVAGRFPFDDHGYAELHWQADGRRVLFLTSNSCSTGGIYAVSAAGGPTRAVTHDARDLAGPSWSPDGTRFAYSVEQYDCHLGPSEPIAIETRAADGSGIQEVVPHNGFATQPAYSPDGRRMAYAYGTSSDKQGIQTIDIGGSTPVDLPGASGAPVWSPDGTRIAFVAGRSVEAVPAGGGAPQVLVKGLPVSTCGGGLAWSPDGKQLALGGAAGISLVTLGTPATTRLAISVKCAGDPSFSPDGKAVAFDAPAPHALGGQTAIMAANTDGSGIRILSTVPFRQSVDPSWQPGG